MEWFSHWPSTMKTFIFAAAITIAAASASAQTATAKADEPPTTAPSQELTFDLSGYNYVEPGDTAISIHGLKFGGEYTGAFSLNSRHHWFARANVRAATGSTDYDGWCAPWFISPDRSSPNGYFLDLGEYSPCDDSGNKDWYAEGRGLIGKDFVRHEWTFSPNIRLTRESS